MFSQKSALTAPFLTTLAILSYNKYALANSTTKKQEKQSPAEITYTPAQNGFLGLNTVPNARTDPPGTLRAGISTLDPYLNSYISAQIAAPLSLTFRQTAEISSLKEKAKKLYPGIDFKLRLLKENTFRPAVALGIQSAIGHQRMAGEYIALSKRYNNIDLTTGLGWGRYGTAGHFKNPLSGISSHFNKKRDFNSETPNKPSNWFTGENVGFFGGIEYFLPYNGFSIKFDYGADRYKTEKASFDYKNSSPWGLGLAYSYKNWLSANIGLQGKNKLMGRISLQSSPEKWPFSNTSYSTSPRPIYKKRPVRTNTSRMISEAAKDHITISDIWINDNKTQLFATLHLPENISAPKHAGRAARHIAANAQNSIEEITLTLQSKSLRGTRISLMRNDIEKAFKNKSVSSNEIWQNTSFGKQQTADNSADNSANNSDYDTNPGQNSPFLPPKKLSIKKDTSQKPIPPSLQQIAKTSSTTSLVPPIHLIFENHIGLSEEDSGLLRRSSIILETSKSPFLGFISGFALRLNLSDNLGNIAKLRPASLLPVRSDIDKFTDKFISIDHAHLSYMHSITPQLHTALSLGYLEEAYAGFGGQIIYRPIYSRFAAGAELWQVCKRDPDTPLNILLKESKTKTGHANLWYDLPYYDVTAKLGIGRYLQGDTGFSAELEKNFKNGAKLSASTTITNAADADLFGGTTHSYHSLNLSMPLGSLPVISSGSEIRIKNAPFGRDSAQTLNKPIDLYNLTQSFTINDIARHWPEITQ